MSANISLTKLATLAVSLAILGIIYWRINLADMLTVLAGADIPLTILAFLLLAPIVMMASGRLYQLAAHDKRLSYAEANRLILVANSFNLILPSKMGDLVKAYFMTRHGGMPGSFSLSLVIYEKTMDLLALLLWCAVGLIYFPHRDALFWSALVFICVGLITAILVMGSSRAADFFFNLLQKLTPAQWSEKISTFSSSWAMVQGYVWKDRKRLAWVFFLSMVLWFVHFLQIWLFILALNAWVPLTINLALAPFVILAGLLPVTFGGIGMRDAAFIFLFAPFFNAETGAALGLLGTARYLLPGLCGLLFLNRYLNFAGKPR